MSNYVNRKTFRFIFAWVFLLAACAVDKPAPEDPGGPSEPFPEMANPAAGYCAGLGYPMENVTRDGGEDADCIFPDGSSCAQWDFLAGRCGEEYSYCQSQGFILENENNFGICRFPDGSSCDEYQFFTGACSQGDNPGESEEPVTQIRDVYHARDYLAAYFESQYGIELGEPWVEQDITPADAVGSNRTRFVSGPLTIVISAQASAPSPNLYTIEEASNIANGFYWEGTLHFDGELTESTVNPPGTILSELQARDAIMAHILTVYDLPEYAEWIDQGISPTGSNTVVRVYTSGPWVVEVELVPAAPLVASYHVTADHLQEEIRWEGDISYQGDITEVDFAKSDS